MGTSVIRLYDGERWITCYSFETCDPPPRFARHVALLDAGAPFKGAFYLAKVGNRYDDEREGRDYSYYLLE